MIKELVDKIPEIYQTIYKHPEYKTSRDCNKRLKYITDIIKSYQNKTGKKDIKVLDIGCAQGYYSLQLAKLGCDVTGLDFNRYNIDLCKGLAEENKLNVKFIYGTADNNFPYQDYDIIIALSVFHHIALTSFSYAKTIFNNVCSKADIVISEMAVKEEDLFWSKNLPFDYSDWFSEQKFYKEITFTDTHLGSVKRPLVVSSNKYFICGDTMYKIDSATNKSYKEGLDLPYKNLYFSGDSLCKIAHKSKINPPHSLYMYNEVINESSILKKGISFLPLLTQSEITEQYAITVQKMDKGVLLYDLIDGGEPINKTILIDILDDLIELENLGLYHSDIRTWNVVIKTKAFLIDAGAIRQVNIDCSGDNTYVAYYKLLAQFLPQGDLESFVGRYSKSNDKTFTGMKNIISTIIGGKQC